MTTLARIKRMVLAGQFELSEKARVELFSDGLLEQDIVESIANAKQITKTIRSTRPQHRGREYLYVIVSENLQGVCLYTKGKIVDADGIETYYFFVSSKCAE